VVSGLAAGHHNSPMLTSWRLMKSHLQSAIVKARSSTIAGLLLCVLATPLAAQPQAVPTRVVVVSDLNESYGSTRYSAAVDDAVRRTVALAPDLVISTGDMIAGQRLSPPLNAGEVRAMWEAFDRHVTTPLAQAGLPVAEYTPLEVKQAIVGYGGADKNQVQQMVRALLELPEVPRPDDTADALAIAICHVHSYRMKDY